MTALTVRDVDDAVAIKLKAEARRRGMSVNALVKIILRDSLGVSKAAVARRYTDLDHLAGTWTSAEARAFARSVQTFERVDPELWR